MRRFYCICTPQCHAFILCEFICNAPRAPSEHPARTLMLIDTNIKPYYILGLLLYFSLLETPETDLAINATNMTRQTMLVVRDQFLTPKKGQESGEKKS